jgi:hypothetical protein
MRVVECASFVAAPSSALHLLQPGVSVICIFRRSRNPPP